VAYLGHVISSNDVSMDQLKVQSILNWPLPQTVKAVCAFLGLVGYYRWFIKNYGMITDPPTKILCKDGFRWSTEAEEAFYVLQCALTMVPILQLPAFDTPFVVKCDALGCNISAVLHQIGGPMAFFSRQLVPRHSKLATYERELIGVVQVMRHW
jgi:hypothetical protein